MYESIILMGDLNVDTLDTTKDTNNCLSDSCNTFSLKNIINGKTCFKTLKGTSIDLLLRNWPKSFHKTGIIKTGLSDHHKYIISFVGSHFTKLPPKKI